MRRIFSVFSISFLLLSMLVPAAPVAAQISFVEPLSSWVTPGGGDAAYGVAVADFNKDGKPDVAFLQGTGGVAYVSVMLGNGDGTFSAPVNVFTFPVNDYSQGILARDFNGDGKMDIAFTLHQLNEIVFLPGNGDGSFGAPVISTTTQSPDFMQTADLDGDGKLDVVMVDQPTNMVSVAFGKGDGTFQTPVDYALAGTTPQDLAVADVNHDGHPDILVGDYDSESVNILLNDGTGKFAAALGSPFSVGMEVLGLEVADFNGDGKLDIATAGFGNCNPGPSAIRVSLGNGDGTFQAPLKEQCLSGYAPSRHYSDNQPIDLNGDGKFDIVFGDSNNNEIDVGLGNGDGTFTQAVYVASQGPVGPGISFVDGNGVGDIGIADFNGDGVLDLLATENGRGNRQGGISLLPAVRPGVFASPGVFQGGSSGGYHAVVVGDFNRDGKFDAAVLTGEGNSGGAGILLGNGDGTFGPIAYTPGCNCSGEFYSWLDAASFRANGIVDLLILANDGVQAGPPPRVIVQYGNGDGTFGGESQIYAANSNDPYFFPVGAAIGDLTGDGRPDIVVLSLDAANGDRVYVFANNGSGSFGSPNIINLGAVNANGNDRAVAIGDFNGDGKPDLVVHTVDPGNTEHIWFLGGNGDGTFAAPVDRGSYGDATQGIVRYAAADMKGNGRLDLVGLGFGHGVYVSLGNGDGTFQAAKEYTADQGYLTDMAVADFDGDGKPDVAVVGRCCGGSTGPQGVAVLRNKGDGTLAAPLHPSIGEANPSGIAVGDLNGNGYPDLVVLMSSSSNQMNIAAVLVVNNSAQASVSPASLTFANQAIGTTSAAKKVTLTNTGKILLDISSITATGNFAISASTCGATLAVGKKCKVSVTFTPTETGVQTGTLVFADNAVNSPQTVALSGTGILPATLTPASATYHAQKVGTTSSPKTFKLANNQSVDLNGIAISTSGDFAVSATTCSTSLAAKKKCTISVTFTPTQTGTRTGQLSVSDSASNSPQTASLSGTGQ
ncbi:MAG TPA: FG-GAP-like repeat-containing protein [Terriglobales bacterium]|nr:FG-GAP-like repeat-containing protein [Terriglobales bacterium]